MAGGRKPYYLVSRLNEYKVTDSRRFRLAVAACCSALWPLLGAPDQALDNTCARILRVLRSDPHGRARPVTRRLLQSEIESRADPRELLQSEKVAVLRTALTRHSLVAIERLLVQVLETQWLHPKLGNRPESAHPLDTSLWARDWERWRVLALGLCAAIRDVFPCPAAPVRFEPLWRTETVTALARGVAERHTFDVLPVLADALEEAGCDDAVILDHCRGSEQHFPGNWVVDVILG